uniref:Uncharacterized protein n=1 Tax=Rhodosorus marinus TaxID=101924 RepID=A0A7S3E6N7_9RHOD
MMPSRKKRSTMWRLSFDKHCCPSCYGPLHICVPNGTRGRRCTLFEVHSEKYPVVAEIPFWRTTYNNPIRSETHASLSECLENALTGRTVRDPELVTSWLVASGLLFRNSEEDEQNNRSLFHRYSGFLPLMNTVVQYNRWMGYLSVVESKSTLRNCAEGLPRSQRRDLGYVPYHSILSHHRHKCD